jgi:hypothetical protein
MGVQHDFASHDFALCFLGGPGPQNPASRRQMEGVGLRVPSCGAGVSPAGSAAGAAAPQQVVSAPTVSWAAAAQGPGAFSTTVGQGTCVSGGSGGNGHSSNRVVFRQPRTSQPCRYSPYRASSRANTILWARSAAQPCFLAARKARSRRKGRCRSASICRIAWASSVEPPRYNDFCLPCSRHARPLALDRRFAVTAGHTAERLRNRPLCSGAPSPPSRPDRG